MAPALFFFFFFFFFPRTSTLGSCPNASSTHTKSPLSTGYCTCIILFFLCFCFCF
ncbi:hypothetical protein F4810DRAFT_694301 [Camillea tinctor]|nr:hypothetical protein F4810DRAFT_694301 [Camillea tinctor]